MKAFLKNLIQKNGYLVLVVAVLFTAGYIVDLYLGSDTSSRLLRDRIQNFLQERERDFVKLAKDTARLHVLVNQGYSKQELTNLVEKKYTIVLYEKDSINRLKFWNDQRALPADSLLRMADGNYFTTLMNGQYEFVKRTIAGRNSDGIIAVSLIPVRWQYYITIDNLRPEFVDIPAAEEKFHITLNKTALPVKSSFGNTLFYLSQRANAVSGRRSVFSLVLILAGILLLLFIIQNIAHAIAERFGSIKGIVFVVGVLIALRLVVYLFPGLLNLRQYELFDPKIYGTNFILSSLGDLLINSLLFCWIILFIRRESRGYSLKSSAGKWRDWLLRVVILAVLVFVTLIFAYIVQSLVADAKISFNVTNILNSLTAYSFIGFIVLASLALSYFFFTQLLVRLMSTLIGGDTIVDYIVMAFTGLLLLTFIRNTQIVELDVFVLIWLLLYVWLIQRRLFSGWNARLNISEVLFWLFIFSVSVSAVIISENHKIELDQRKRTAERLSEQADPSSEKVLSIALTYFDNDFFYANFYRFTDPASNAYLKDSISNRSFITYRRNYGTKVYTYGPDEKPLFNDEAVSYGTLNTIFIIQGKPTSVQDLRYYEKSFDKFTYIYRKTVTDDSLQRVIGYVFILSEPKKYTSDDLLVPELFQQKKEFLPEYSPIYSYAIYNGNELISYYNNYSFPTHLTEDQIPATDFSRKRNGSYDELWYRIAEGKIVIIAKKDNSLLEALTLFSYLFSAFLFLVALFRLSSIIISTRLQWSQLKLYLQFNIRSQIHTTIIFISLFSFIIIGIATIFFFISRYNHNNQEQLSRAREIVAREIRGNLGSHINYDSANIFDLGSKEELSRIVDNVAEVHGNDINLYDLRGNLTISSNPFVYNKGILSEKMHPLAYYNLHQLNAIEYFNNEQMGRISYLSVYCPLRDEKGNAYAYLNIPSFRTQDELKQEISNFLVTIINLNAFIFLVAGTIALFLTNRITYSFTLISEKMRQINLGRTNEEIEWKRDDEIGGLVKEYNKMVKKLEESAMALAKSEREGAWREMARQVAHEIKNPLTPMKLSIQYLQKAVDNDSINVKEMTASVAKTLVEQIDHLSKIASDFSQFANIGNPKNEFFDLHEMLYSLTSLYETTENLLFKWVPVHQHVIVFADKTQLNRLFTNLLQNAVEACYNKEKWVVSMSEEINDSHIIVKVSDNGDGIPLQTQSKIFMPNFTTKSSGTGLGLAMSKTIVEQAKGRIWFETTEGEGTTFFVEFALASVPES